MPNGITVLDITKKLNIDPKEVSIIFINNRHAELEHTLKDNDILALFPPIGGG
ncbi:MAG: MoaD/ThiS family protein [Spirochaetota bacterium]